MGFLEDLMVCSKCAFDAKDTESCMKCELQRGVKEGFYRLKNMDMNNVIIILIILVVLMYMDIIPNPFKSKVNKQHLQYFFF